MYVCVYVCVGALSAALLQSCVKEEQHVYSRACTPSAAVLQCHTRFAQQRHTAASHRYHQQRCYSIISTPEQHCGSIMHASRQSAARL